MMKKNKDKKNKFSINKPLFSYPSKQKDYFVESLSLLISSKMGILPALKITQEEIKSKGLRKVIGTIIKQVEDGSSLWRAVESSHLFSDYFISLLKIGESSGRLEENLKIIAIQSKKEKAFKSKIRSAIMYPVFVMVVAIVIALGVAWFILPKLATVFSSLRMDLPLVTEKLIEIGIFLSSNGSWVVPLIAFFIFLVIFFFFILPQTRYIGRSLLFYLPGSKKIIQQVELSRFGFILGTLLKAGLPVTVSFDFLIQATSFPIYKKLFRSLREDINQGLDFQDAFNNYKLSKKLIPRSIQRMINSGQQSGNLEEILLKISEDMESKTETTAKNLSVILEPVLLVIVWLGVVAVALAVILPIYSLVGGLNEDRNSINSSPPPPPVPVVEMGSYQSESSDFIPPTNEDLATTTDETVDLLPEVEVTENSLGYLNVRDQRGLSGEIIERIYPGEVYEYINLENNWYQIKLSKEQTGWVSGNYVKEISYE